MLNHITLIGRLTKDPESKYTPNGIAVATFRIAVDRFTKNAETGEKETDFFNVVTWRRTAEFVTQYITKGRLVAVEGRMQMRSWTGQDGQRQTIYEVSAENVHTLDRPREGDAPGAPEGREFAAAPAGRPSPAAEMEDNDPFADD